MFCDYGKYDRIHVQLSKVTIIQSVTRNCTKFSLHFNSNIQGKSIFIFEITFPIKMETKFINALVVYSATFNFLGSLVLKFWKVVEIAESDILDQCYNDCSLYPMH